MTGCLNKIILIGNLSGDPEIRYTDSKIAVCNFNIGVREKRKVNNEWVLHTEWFRIVSFGKTAENSSKYLKKGKPIYVEGRLQTRIWQNGDKSSYINEVIANRIIFLGFTKNEKSFDDIDKENIDNEVEEKDDNEEQFLF